MELRLATGHSQPHGFWRTLVPRVLLGWVTGSHSLGACLLSFESDPRIWMVVIAHYISAYFQDFPGNVGFVSTFSPRDSLFFSCTTQESRECRLGKTKTKQRRERA